VNEDFKILDLKEHIALNENEGGRNRPQKCFDNIKKNAGICNENLRTIDYYGEENKNSLEGKNVHLRRGICFCKKTNDESY
jgi:hypothetical protein